MNLKRAGNYFAGRQTCYNPLWQRVGGPFLRALAVGADSDASEDPDLYVKEREGDGVTEADIQEHLDADSKTLYVVQGPAGIGKTTFLTHAVKQYLRGSADRFLIWIDVLKLVEQPEKVDLYTAVESRLTFKLDEAIRSTLNVDRWYQCFLENWSDPVGEAGVILDRIRSGESLQGSLLEALQKLVRSARFIDITRVRFRYLRSESKRIPVVVLDNVDRLPPEVQLQLFRLGFAIAAGSGEPGDHAVAYIAMRPETVSENVRPHEGVATCRLGTLQPPRVGPLLQRRLARFFRSWHTHFVSGPTVHTERRRDIALQEHAKSAAELPNDVARRLLETLAEAVVGGTAFEAQAERLQMLAGYNNRLILLALAGYVASGHHEWDRWQQWHFSQEAVRAGLSKQKVFKALLLGTNAIYSGRVSWAYNLFSDGKQDVVGAMITLRILKQMQRVGDIEGMTATTLADNLEQLFGYPRPRTLARLSELRVGRLVEERLEQKFALTRSGKAYLPTVTDFEYLQHVLVDAWVDGKFVIECRDRDELPSIRFTRVLRYAQWVREVEVEEYRHVISSDRERLYDECYGEQTVAGSLASTLKRVLSTLPGNEQWGTGVLDAKSEIDRLEANSTFDSVRRAARGEAAAVS